MNTKTTQQNWYKVAEPGELPEGRVKTVTASVHSMALTHIDGAYYAMDNRCPHQGGPLGEGSIEAGKGGECMLRCPWHGWDFDPKTGLPPGGHEDTGQQMFPVESREDGVYVAIEEDMTHQATVTDVMAETMTNWGVTSVFGIVGHSNLGLADALRLQEQKGRLTFFGVRHEGAAAFACSGYAKLTGKPAACLTIAGPGATNLMTGLWDAKVDRAPVLALTGQVQVQVFGPGAFQDIDLQAAFAPVARFSQPVLHHSRHAELMTLACKTAIVERDVAHLIFPDNVQTVIADDITASSPEGRVSASKVLPEEEVLNDALSWPDEAARFLMLWMTAFIAPSGMRWGGFVAIDMLPRALPRVPSLSLGLVLLVLSLAVLLTAVGHGYNHTFGFGGKFDSASLRVPLDWIGYESVKVKLRYMYGSLLVCVVLLIMVTVELILRMLVALVLPDADLPADDAPEAMLGAD